MIKKAHVVGKSIYGNVRVLAPDGQQLCRTTLERANWYVDRNLAVRIDGDIIQLTFEPQARTDVDDPFLQSEKKDICVVCGSIEKLSRHHIIPHSYRRYFSKKTKSHCCHDVVITCVPCHEQYEKKAEELKEKLAKQYDAPIAGHIDLDMVGLMKAAYALKTSNNIPEHREKQLLNVLRKFFNKEDISKRDIEIAVEHAKNYVNNPENKHGKIVISKINNLQSFYELWRYHFLHTMNPQHMPEHWNPRRKVRQ